MVLITVDDKDIRDGLSKLFSKLENLEPVMKSIGNYLMESTKLRFRQQQAPDGTPWEPSRRARLQHGQTLVDSTTLVRSITNHSNADYILVGTNEKYGAMHQFGARKGQFGSGVAHVESHKRKVKGKKKRIDIRAHDRRVPYIPWGDVPARPYLGISSDDKEQILETMTKYLGESWEK